jgi:hypothetical protein
MKQYTLLFSLALAAIPAFSQGVPGDHLWLRNYSFPNQTGTFYVEVDAIPQGNDVGCVGISDGPCLSVDSLSTLYTAWLDGGSVGPQPDLVGEFQHMACIAAFGGITEGKYTIGVRNGPAYAQDSVVPYQDGVTYTLRFDVDIPSHTYGVTVSAAGQAAVQIASGYDFRTEQNAVAQLNNWCVYDWNGSVDASNFRLNGNPVAREKIHLVSWAPELSVYPNPFCAQTAITIKGFSSQRGAGSILGIYDIQGKLVQSWAPERSPANGSPLTLRWNAAGRSPGAYLLHLQSPDGVYTRPLLLVK